MMEVELRVCNWNDGKKYLVAQHKIQYSKLILPSVDLNLLCIKKCFAMQMDISSLVSSIFVDGIDSSQQIFSLCFFSCSTTSSSSRTECLNGAHIDAN